MRFLPKMIASFTFASAAACGNVVFAAEGAGTCVRPAPGAAGIAVGEVLAGDTLRLVDGTVVRLAAVAPPSEALAAGTEKGGQLARDGLRSLVEGQTVVLQPIGEGPDRHGRTHAYAWLADGRLLQAALLRAGFGRARWLPGEEACLERLLSAEAEARRGKLGLWNGPDYAIRAAEDSSLADRTGLYELVEGRVLSVGNGSRMIFLDFGRNYRQDFTIMVPPPVAEGLAGRGLAVETLVSRRVRVRGVIEESGGPAIRLNDPAELELLD